MHSSARARLVGKVPFAIINMLRNSGNKLLLTECERSVQGRHRNSAANDGSLPGATAGAHAAGLAVASRGMALAVPRIRLRLPVPVASRRVRSLAGGCGCGTGDTMNVFAANDLEAADLLALAGSMTTARRRRLSGTGQGSSAAGPAGVRAGLVIAAVADWG